MTSGGTPAERLGPYRLVRRLGRGGMGEVWLAEHEQIKSQVAIKLVLADPHDEDAAARFLREARATARIRHPGIVAVSDFGERPGGGAYLVMELLDGESLAERLQRGPLPVALVLELGVQIAEALAAAHGADVIHRDLKPANVFLVRDAAARAALRAKLLDFGVAKAIGASAEELGQTTTGALVGTPVYMAPEQCTSRLGPVDHRADLYAMGVLLYEMTTGAPPFRGSTFGDLIDQHLHATPTPPRVVVPSIPGRLDVLIVNLLAKDRDDRPATASDVARVLDELRERAPPAALDDTLAGAARPGSKASPAPSAPMSLATQETDARPPTAASSTPLSPATQETDARPPTAASSTPLSPATQETGARPLVLARSRSRARRSWLAIAVGVIALAGAGTAVALFAARDDGQRSAQAKGGDGDGGDQLVRACAGTDGQACLVLAMREQRDPAPPDLSRVHARFATACERGVVEGCAEAAERLAMGVGVRADYPTARALAVDACKTGSALGCELAGELLWHGIGGPVEQTEGLTRWRRGCELGSADACQHAAKLFAYGLGVPKDVATARTQYERAHELAHAGCVKDDARACAVLGQLISDGALAAADTLRGADHFLRACELGNGAGCSVLGEQHAFGTGVARDPARALELLRRGCERGEPEACISRGLGAIQGAFGKPDGPAGLAIVRAACELHGDRYCGTLGLLHAAGIGAPQDARLAAQLLERACAAGDPDACSSAADLVVPGEPRDPARLEALHHRACQLASPGGCLRVGKLALERGDHEAARTAFEVSCALSEQQTGCDALAGMYLDGTGVPKDPARGRALLEEACRQGAPVACHQLALRLQEGRGLERRPAEALVLFDKACQLGVPPSCVAAAALLTTPPRGITADVARARVLRERACSLDADTCVAAAKRSN